MLAIRDETFEGLFAFTPHYYSQQGLDVLCWSRDIPVQETDVSYAEMKRIERGLSLFIRGRESQAIEAGRPP
jgi:hypothetical protein